MDTKALRRTPVKTQKAPANPMRTVYRKLGAQGLPRGFVKSTLLPSWWDDEAALTPSGFSQALMLLRRHAGVELASLREETGPARFADDVACRLKASRRHLSKGDRGARDLAPARALAVRASELAILGASGDAMSVPPAREVRDEILASGRPWIDLDALLDYCWDHGVPVLHFSGLPRTLARMQGLAVCIGGRFAIVTADAHRSCAWQLFVVAHELGHVALGHHHGENVVVFDEEVNQDSPDAEEAAANAYAVELLAAGRKFRARRGWLSAERLASEAVRLGRELAIDPGHIALNYGHHVAFAPVAMAALRHVERDANALALIQTKLAERLDWSLLPPDGSEFLMRACGPQSPQAA
jgi:hypothetical protein